MSETEPAPPRWRRLLSAWGLTGDRRLFGVPRAGQAPGAGLQGRSSSRVQRAGGRRAYRWLGAVPAVCMLGGIPFANRVEPYVLGLPFLLFWILLWVVATSAVLRVVYALDQGTGGRKGQGRRHGSRAGGQ